MQRSRNGMSNCLCCRCPNCSWAEVHDLPAAEVGITELSAFCQVEDDMARQKRQLSVLKERNNRLKAENAELRDKASLLERLDMHKYSSKSACMLEFTHFKIRETY